jgi:sulfate adenylyltransferase
MVAKIEKINMNQIEHVYICTVVEAASSMFYHGLKEKYNVDHNHSLSQLKKVLQTKNNLIISGICNPVDRNLSYFFQTYSNKRVNSMRYKENDHKGEKYYVCNEKELLSKSIDEVIKLHKKSPHLHSFNNWFDDFFEITDIDTISFNKEQGLQLYKLKNDNYLLFYSVERLQNNMKILEDMFQVRFTYTNNSDAHIYNQLHKDVKNKIIYYDTHIKQLFDTNIINHFYSIKTIKNMIKTFTITENTNYPTIILNDRQLCDLELLMNGSFAPLTGYLNQEDYLSVINNMRLTNGKLWPIPITLMTSNVQGIDLFKKVYLKDQQNNILAILHVQSVYKPDIDLECRKVYGTLNHEHSYVNYLMNNKGCYYLGGEIEAVSHPQHYDYKSYRVTPYKMKRFIKHNNWKNVIGFQTRNPMHKSHYALTQYAISKVKETGEDDVNLLLHPVIGPTQECDINHHTRINCYKKILKHYDEDHTVLSLLPLAMRMAGPREALLHAMVRKNYGCTHFIIGRDHAGPSCKNTDGSSIFEPYAAQELVKKHSEEIGIKLITSPMIGYNKVTKEYEPISGVNRKDVLFISGTNLRKLIKEEQPVPDWYTFPEIIEELRLNAENQKDKGLCLYFVGLSGSGKSTLANTIIEQLRDEYPKKKVTILDGDIVRRNLSKGLGFTKEDRSTNVCRVGYVASEVVKHGGICVCANIAPYEADRSFNRKLISQYGKYVEVFVNTPLSVCEERDVKGLYKLARQGVIKNFTGISDPFEKPTCADIIITSFNIKDNINQIIAYVKSSC